MQLLLMELGKKFLEVLMFVKETYEQWVKTIPSHTSFYGGGYRNKPGYIGII